MTDTLTREDIEEIQKQANRFTHTISKDQLQTLCRLALKSFDQPNKLFEIASFEWPIKKSVFNPIEPILSDPHGGQFLTRVYRVPVRDAPPAPAPPSADAVLSLMPEIEHMLLRIRNVCAEQGFNEMLIDVRNLQERTLKATGKWRKLGMKE